MSGVTAVAHDLECNLMEIPCVETTANRELKKTFGKT
jgi:hypothetical protein